MQRGKNKGGGGGRLVGRGGEGGGGRGRQVIHTHDQACVSWPPAKLGNCEVGAEPTAARLTCWKLSTWLPWPKPRLLATMKHRWERQDGSLIWLSKRPVLHARGTCCSVLLRHVGLLPAFVHGLATVTDTTAFLWGRLAAGGFTVLLRRPLPFCGGGWQLDGLRYCHGDHCLSVGEVGSWEVYSNAHGHHCLSVGEVGSWRVYGTAKKTTAFLWGRFAAGGFTVLLRRPLPFCGGRLAAGGFTVLPRRLEREREKREKVSMPA